jgi:hypothetical protein
MVIHLAIPILEMICHSDELITPIQVDLKILDIWRQHG